MELNEFITSERYDLLLQQVQQARPLDINNSVPDVLLGHDLKRISAAETTVDTLYDFLDDHQRLDQVAQFISRILSEDDEDGDDEEYPPGAQPSADEAPALIKKLPYYKSFLLTFIIQFYLINRQPERLDGYYKATRTPGAKAHKKKMTAFYQAVMSAT